MSKQTAMQALVDLLKVKDAYKQCMPYIIEIIDEVYLPMEREQIKESYKAGFNLRDTFNWECDAPWDTEADLKHNEQEFDKYYIETYKGG